MKKDYAKVVREMVRPGIKFFIEVDGKMIEMNDKWLDYCLFYFLRKVRMTKEDLTEISNERLNNLRLLFNSICITDCGRFRDMIRDACISQYKTAGPIVSNEFDEFCRAAAAICVETQGVPYSRKTNEQ